MSAERIIYDFFLVLRDRATGDEIGGAPMPGGAAHFKANLAPLLFVLSFVRPVNLQALPADLARDLSLAFGADVYARPEGEGEWQLLASGAIEAGQSSADGEGSPM